MQPQALAPVGANRLCTLLALSAPPLLAFSLSPSATMLNQLLAVAAWGLALLLLGGRLRPGAVRAVAWPLAALGVVGIGVVASWTVALPATMALSALLMLVCTGAVLLAAQAGDDDGPLLQPVLAALLLAGLLSSLIALIQVFVPDWADGEWIARSGLAGRAVGNLRQPNHLSTLLLLGLMALVPLADAGLVLGRRLAPPLAAGLAALMLLGVVLTASRTGVVGTLMLGLWGLADRRLTPRVRWALVAAPLVYLLCWLGLAAWAHQTAHTFGGEARLAEGDLSASRFGIWANTLSLIAAQPWAGVGFGEFNFAWTLTPFPGRPVAFFDHSHNLLLQLAVELGLPAALLIAGLMVWAVVQAFKRSSAQTGSAGPAARAALMMVLLAGVHSMLEYPLWYAYFLLPTAWALGHALRPPTSTEQPAPVTEAPATRGPALSRIAGALMLAGALFATWDYLRVTVIYQPGDTAAPLNERIADGERAWLFGHHASYAAATTAEPPSQAMASFASTTHALLDTRLMLAWAQALKESGHVDKARYVAARLREFRNPASAEFFAPCALADTPASPQPWQCQAPSQPLSWREFQR